jgi:hypothetical protein
MKLNITEKYIKETKSLMDPTILFNDNILNRETEMENEMLTK